MVNNVYNYNPNTKILIKLHGKSLIRLNDEENIEILVENIGNELWNFYNSDNLVIEENRISQYPTNSYYYTPYTNHYLCPITTPSHQYPTSIIKWAGDARYTIDLKQLLTDVPDDVVILKTIPKATCLGGELEHKNNGHHCYIAILFNDYYYTFGVDDDDLFYDTCRRIHKDKDGSDNSNWEILDAPWDGNRHIHLLPNEYRIRI